MKALVSLALLLASFPALVAQEPSPPARLRSAVGTVILRGKNETAPPLNEPIPAEVAVVALPGARGVLEAKEGDVRLTLAGNLPGLSAPPALESEVVLHQAMGAKGADAKAPDLDFTLKRGRAILENKREEGPILVRIRLGKRQIDARLLNAKSLVALEFISRWPEGAPFLKQPTEGHEPVGELFLVVVRGKVEVEVDGERSVPPGPSLYRWSTRQAAYAVAPLKKPPEWLNPGLDKSPAARALHDAVEKVRRAIADKGVRAGIKMAGESPAPLTRLAAILSAVALDDAPPIVAMEDPSPVARDGAIEGLRNFIGRSAKHDLAFHEALLARKWKPGQADIAMELLHGLTPQERGRPETLETLVDYLQSDQLGIRELARWTLVRLFPQGAKIDYDAGAAADVRGQKQAEWRKLIATPAPK